VKIGQLKPASSSSSAHPADRIPIEADRAFRIVTAHSGHGRKSVNFEQNPRSASSRITGHVRSESAVKFVRNTHDLRQEIAGHINAHRAAIEKLIVPNRSPGPRMPPPEHEARQTQQHIALLHQMMYRARHALTERYGGEANIYVLELETARREVPSMPATTTITIGGDNLGVVQAGANSTAHVQIDTTATADLVKALENLRAAIPQAAELSAQQRRESSEIITALVAEARGPKPNKQKIIDQLKTLALIVQAVGTLSHAWAPVTHAIAHLFPGAFTWP
jgi:hypothetical protein